MKKTKKTFIITIIIPILVVTGGVLYFNLQNNNQNRSSSFISGEIVSVSDEKITVKTGSIDLSTNQAGQEREMHVYYNDSTTIVKSLPGYTELVSEDFSRVRFGAKISVEYRVSSEDKILAHTIILLNE